jgi:sec-independent protein translocase protein TatB
MFGVNPIKIMVIVAVVLLLLGPDKLPEVAHKLGSSWRALKRIQERVESEVREALPDLPSSGELARMARSPVNLLNQLADQVDAREASPAPATSNPYLEAADPIADAPLITPAPSTSTERREEQATLPPDPSLN